MAKTKTKIVKNKDHCRSEILFCIALLLSSVSYVGYWLLALKRGVMVYFAYDMSESGILTFMRYMDDIIFIVLGFYLAVKHLKKKFIYFVCFGLLYGEFGLLVNNISSFTLLFSGMRAFIPILAVFEWYLIYQDQRLDCCFFKNFVNLAVVLQVLTCLILSSTCEVFRNPGLFGNAGSLGIFSSGVALFYFVYYTQGYGTNWFEYYLYQIFLLYVIVASDSRSALIVFLILLMIGFIVRLKLSERVKFAFCCIGLITGLPLFVLITNLVSPRGNLLIQNLTGGRISILINFFRQDILTILFGGGLGYGTNSAVTMGITDLIVDGTFNTLLYQFGLIGGGLLIFLLGYSMFRITNHSSVIFRLGFIGGVFLISFNASVFEAGGFLILIAFCYYMIYQRKRKVTDFDISEFSVALKGK